MRTFSSVSRTFFTITVVSVQSSPRLQYILFIMNRPLLGTIDTPWEKVDAFYKFWREFHSWRVYSAYDEYNLEVPIFVFYDPIRSQTRVLRSAG